jgi:hypothetical protein
MGEREEERTNATDYPRRISKIPKMNKRFTICAKKNPHNVMYKFIFFDAAKLSVNEI